MDVSIDIEVSRSPVDAEASVALLQAVADPVRWTVLSRLAVKPACVCDIQDHVPVAGNLLSYHLKVLREAGLVTATRRGRWMDYALAPDAEARLAAALPTVVVGERP
ncbi:ArsR/SmtB family transcription factor [Demequina aurantiaca]|uniref:ArsR/SmtB family transcription factor n=1 Tax=Demequina aurantiaca TaxID=676200 RepID=UPI003D34C283